MYQFGVVNAFVYGWLPENSITTGLLGISDPTWWEDGAGKAAFGLDNPTNGAETFAHEIGHLLGRRHTNTVWNINDVNCASRQSNDQKSDVWRAYVDIKSDWYREDGLPGPPPFPNSNIQEFGLDASGFGWLISSNTPVKNPSDTYDFMSYCGELSENNVWTSPWTYNHIFSELLQPQNTFADNITQASENLNDSNNRSLSGIDGQILTTHSDDRYMIVSGLIFTDDTAILDPIWVINPPGPRANQPSGSEYCIETKDLENNTLSQQCFDLNFRNYETMDETNVNGFNLMLPYSEGVSRIVVRKGNLELAFRDVSTDPPIVKVISPNGGEIWPSDSVQTLTWDAFDANDDDLTFMIMYSYDGVNWIPVGNTTTNSFITIDSNELAGSDIAKIKVIATDGVNTSSDESDGVFSVDTKLPKATIISPPDEIIPADTDFYLEGYGYDLEDGILEGSNLLWTSNIDGNLGNGNFLLTSLSVGEHVVTLSVTDSSGNSTSDSITIFSELPVLGVGIDGPNQGLVNTNYRITANVSPISVTQLITFSWQATDHFPVTHTSAVSDTITYTWNLTGTKFITVTATNALGTVTETHAITIYTPVSADFTASPIIGATPLNVTFTNTSTGDYTTSLWDFGDGITSTLQSPTHTYTTEGVYTVTLTVDGPGGTDTLVRSNYITVSAPIAGLSATNDSPTRLGNPTTLTATITAGSNVTYAWDFGDGDTGSGATVSHIYPETGFYTATVTASNSTSSASASTVVRVAGLVNDRLSQDSVSTSYNPSDPRAPAGVYYISADFTNSSSNALQDIFFEVAMLTGGNQVLNADGGPGGVGATVSVPPESLGADGILSPGEAFNVVFEIGLAERRSFDFYVDAYGVPNMTGGGISTTSEFESPEKFGDVAGSFQYEITDLQLQFDPGYFLLYLPVMMNR